MALAFGNFPVQFPHFRQDEQGHDDSGADVRAGACVKQTVEAKEQRQNQQHGNQQNQLTKHGKQRSFQRLPRCLEIVGGYNLEKQSVTLFDPLKGKVEESLERVEEIYDQTGKYAMTVY